MREDRKDKQENIEIASPIIATIAARAASNVAGVIELRGRIGEEFARLVSREGQISGVKIKEEGEQGLILELHLIAEYKVSLPKLSKQVSDRVKREVEAITDIKVKGVEIHIEDIVFSKSKKMDEK